MATFTGKKKKLISSPPTSYQSVQGDLVDDDDDGDSVSTSASISKHPLLPSAPLRLYRWRWFMLVSHCLLNISNGMMWLTFSPIPNFTASYYGITLSEVDAFSTAFFVTSLVAGFICMFMLQKFGLKVAVYTGALLNMVGAGIRVLSTIDPVICSPVSHSGFVMAMIGQILTAAAQPFVLYTPTTLANIWFGPKERAIATGLSSLASPIGIAVVQIVSPHVVVHVSKLPLLLWIYFVPSLVAGVLTLIAFWYKAPPTPPASSLLNVDNNLGLFKGLWMIVKIPSFWVLLLIWGGGCGMFNAFLTLLPQLLCPYGYSDVESGLWGSIMIFSGMLGAFIAGLVLDYTKMFKEVAVITYCFAIFSLLWFYEVYSIGPGVNIAFSLAMFGFFALPLIPACMEVGVEISYPVSAITSSALLWSAAQIIGIIVITVSQAFSYPLPDNLLAINQCASKSPALNDTSMPKCFYLPNNQSVPIAFKDTVPLNDPAPTILFCLALIVANLLILVLFFWPKYKRLESEKVNAFEKSAVYA